MSTEQEEREAFEAWAKGHGVRLERVPELPDEYLWSSGMWAWSMWQTFEERARRASEPRWVPVGERRPEHNARVLLYSPPRPLYPDGQIECRSFTSGRQAGEFSEHPWATHWMPLPPPPPVDPGTAEKGGE